MDQIPVIPSEQLDPPSQKSESSTLANTSSNEKVEEEYAIASSDAAAHPSRTFEPIRVGDREQLHRLASTMSRSESYRSVNDKNDLERVDTLAGVEYGNPVLDPKNPEFDVYKWTRYLMRSFDEEGVKIRRAGVTFKDLNVSGSGSALQLQKNVGSLLMAPLRPGEFFSFGRSPEKQILRNFDGCLKSGELLVVLGRPGSGCSTLLKTMCGQLNGLNMDKTSTLHYNGISQAQMLKEFRGEVIYNQEVDKHFPHLTVGETLEFAASARTPQNRVKDVKRDLWAKHMAQVIMAVFGLSHTYNTKVGNDFVRGVSGGERKRVSIAEMALAGAPIAAWDNSTRGLDAATALEFTKSLRMASNLAGSCHAVAIYQASQAIFDQFDKAVVLYEGREIYFGTCDQAEKYFIDMGYINPPRQTVPDFLTSVTNPMERQIRDGMENKVPRTPEDFEKHWKESPQFASLLKEIEVQESKAAGVNTAQDFHQSKKAQQADHVRAKSPYIISIPMQVKICTKRAYQRIWNDKTSTITTVIGQIIMSLIIGSVFYGTPSASAGFFSKGAVLFFAVLLNALISISEVAALYAQRPIVEKHTSYAFYHPACEAFAGIVSDLPVKFLIAVPFNIILYFLAGLRREPSQFFIFFLFVFILTVTMSGIFRTLAAATKTVEQALALAGVMVLAVVIYTGFTIPRPQMKVWFEWIHYLNPVYYGFEAIIANEFHGQNFECSQFIPSYPNLSGDSFICSVAGSVAGQTTVSGDAFIAANYEYYYSHVWRNLGIIIGFLIFFEVIYLVATELNSSTSSAAEVLVFRRGHVPKYMQNLDKKIANDEVIEAPSARKEASDGDEVNAIPKQTDIFTWRDVSYDIHIKGGERRLLDHVSGWVKPGTLTALMGVSGAGKTTLLDVLASRVTMGVVTGDMFVNGIPRDASFPRKTGYVQQQDLHLETSTVREALGFSAMLRQPKTVPAKEKYAYVEEVIKMLNMEDFAEAVVGFPGKGLNVEQRKLLTIGVELAAKPQLLLFLDEPTSGLDSQSSWAICAFLRKLADHGQAVLSTIHQPSAVLFQEFDRLLFLAKGGKTVYFGEIGEQSRILLEYFQANGARKCLDGENPAEYMLEIIGAGSSGTSSQDWPEVWKKSEQATGIQTELEEIHKDKKSESSSKDSDGPKTEFAMPFTSQLYHVSYRVFQQYWRMPSYIYGKFMLGIASALFIAFSFYRPSTSQAGLEIYIFSIFMLTTIFTTLVQQVMPQFVTQRALYEVRERPSKSYSWAAFLIANVIVEVPYQVFLGIVVWACYYYPIYGANQAAERQGLMLLFIVQFFVFASTFAHMVIAALPDVQTAGPIATLLFALSITFNGVLQPPSALPGFWIFMYRVSPLTYLVAGTVATGVGGSSVTCSQEELSIFNPPAGQTCGQYLMSYLSTAPGYLVQSTVDATSGCAYCQVSSADQFLAGSGIYYSQRWRNFGIGWAYIVFNIAAATLLYYTFRVAHFSPAKIGERVGGLFKKKKA